MTNDVKEISYSKESFLNRSSCVGFINGPYQSIDEVIQQDEKELSEVGGTFTEIANLMMHLIDFSADIDWFGRDRDRYADIAAKLFSKYSDLKTISRIGFNREITNF